MKTISNELRYFNLTSSEETSLLENLRAKRRAEAIDMAPLYGDSFASNLRTLGMHKEAAQVEALVKHIYKLS
jgi:hypothetical protein